MTPQLGTDGDNIVYPVRGIAQGVRRIRRHPQRLIVAYAVSVVGAAALTTVALLAAGYRVEAPLTFLALAGAAAIAERSSVRLTRYTELSMAVLPMLFAAVIFGPLESAL